MMQCEETAGFLIRHPCEESATHKCSFCKKRICDDHARSVEEPADEEDAEAYEASSVEGPVACISCFKQRRLKRSSTRYRYDPYFYGYYYGYHPYGIYDDFDEDDRAAFETADEDLDADGDFESDVEGT